MKMQRRKIDIIIAIDPDVEKNGVAYLNCENKNLEISTLSFPELLDYLRYVQDAQKRRKNPSLLS